MATERAHRDPRLAAQASVLKSWGQEWRKANGKGQQDLGRAAGYGSDESPKSAAVAISRIESGKTDPTGRYRQRLLDALGRTEEELERATAESLTATPRHGVFARAIAGPVYVENEVRRSQILAASNRLTERVTFQLQGSEQTFERARNEFILPFLEYAAGIDWQPLLDARNRVSRGGAAGSQELEIRELRAQTRGSVLKAMSESAAGGIAGVRVGAGTAAGVFAVVSATATASTGTAIASLSGASASSATLAWLGGGSLAAGGTVVLTAIVALPALLALGGVLVWKGRRLRREAEAEAEKLDAAQQALEEMQEAFSRAERWNEAQQAIIQRAGLIGRTIHSRYVEPSVLPDAARSTLETRIRWGELSAAVQEDLEAELELVSIILDARALPIWLGIATVGQAELTDAQEKTATASEEWIHESLALAQFDLDDDEGRVRRRMARESGR